MPRPDPSNVIAGMTDDLVMTPNTPWQRWHAAAVIAERFDRTPATLTLLHALDLTDVHRCPPDTTGDRR